MSQGDRYQVSLIGLGVIATGLLGYFLFQELFPEYKIYQKDYISLEKFRSTYTGEPPPDFSVGVKQIVLLRDDKGPPVIDRCTSCHVALQFEHFSPTKLAYDINGNLQLDSDGNPVKIPNENYVWDRLDAKIIELRKNGDDKLAGEYEALKTAEVHDHVYDVTKVLRMHPLMGRETRPFEYHPIDEYGCVSCHNGNGRGLTTEKAHGPVLDGKYETEDMGYTPSFLEIDEENDPAFSKVFNHKPGHELLFQTTPIYLGSLIQAKCVQCHKSSMDVLVGAADDAALVASRRARKASAVEVSFAREKKEAESLKKLSRALTADGYVKTLESLKLQSRDYTIEPAKMEMLKSQWEFLKQHGESASKLAQEKLIGIFGSKDIVNAFVGSEEPLDKFLEVHPKQNNGSLYLKQAEAIKENSFMDQVKQNALALNSSLLQEESLKSIATDVDLLTYNYRRGEQLYVSQACYACHRIAGLARGGVGPELTREGYVYPWFIKESIVWPQADLKTSTMPNFRLDHQELEDLVTFLLGQTGENKSVSNSGYKIAIQEWESGKKLPWERPVTPTQIQDLNYSMTVFATEGCASCHRLEGFLSDVGYSIEKQGKVDFDSLYREKEWFRRLIPETIAGSELAAALEKHAEEIDQRIVHGVRENALLNQIEEDHPDTVESYYSNFRFASRVHKEQAWKERLHRVLMMYIQEYGLGRLVGPRPNWSGVYRTDEWLMEHFKNPSAHIARSIMPVFPFDETKFYALTYMLDVLGIRNRDSVSEIWKNKGFNPEAAFQTYCAQCHGTHLQGNGPVAEWIYPIPKNLLNSDFLRNLTKERAIQSITHGVKGTPMPPWGEIAKDKTTYDGIPVMTAEEISSLVEWIYASLPGGQVIRTSEDVPKWKYSADDVLQDLKNEGNFEKLKRSEDDSIQHIPPAQALLAPLKEFGHCYAALNPQVSQKPAENEIFDLTAPPVPGMDNVGYYIKKKYYTPQNLQAGKEFFELNCAVCHGRDADGAGLRAGAMQEAKPRMLVNLDWINTRDDLRLLRSIKFGVAGTSMNPWGDLTNSLQRLQLVMYIRTLSEDKKEKRLVDNALYPVFDQGDQQIEMIRSSEYGALDEAEKKLAQIQKQKQSLYALITEGQEPPKEIVGLVQQELNLAGKLNRLKEQDKILIELKNSLKEEKELYRSLGLALVQIHPGDQVLNDYSELVGSLQPRFKVENGVIVNLLNEKNQKEALQSNQKLIAWVDQQQTQLRKEKVTVEGKMSSNEKTESLNHLRNQETLYTKLKNKLISTEEEGRRSRTKQGELINTYNSKNKS